MGYSPRGRKRVGHGWATKPPQQNVKWDHVQGASEPSSTQDSNKPTSLSGQPALSAPSGHVAMGHRSPPLLCSPWPQQLTQSLKSTSWRTVSSWWEHLLPLEKPLSMATSSEKPSWIPGQRLLFPLSSSALPRLEPGDRAVTHKPFGATLGTHPLAPAELSCHYLNCNLLRDPKPEPLTASLLNSPSTESMTVNVRCLKLLWVGLIFFLQ